MGLGQEDAIGAPLQLEVILEALFVVFELRRRHEWTERHGLVSLGVSSEFAPGCDQARSMSVKQLQSLSRQPRAMAASSLARSASALVRRWFTSWAAASIRVTSLSPPAAVKPTLSKSRSPILAMYSRVPGLPKKVASSCGISAGGRSDFSAQARDWPIRSIPDAPRKLAISLVTAAWLWRSPTTSI